MLWSRFPNLKIVGIRWVLTPKEPDFKARLVVLGCQEDPTVMRTDSPTGSRDSLFLVLSCAAQEHWSCGSADAASAYLQAVSTTLHMTCFRGAKVCRKWLQGKVTINSYSLTTS